MSKNVHKSAAVPFVNDKGERSMKRVKVERYVAGKKPAYAKDEDEESIYSSEVEEVEDEEQTDDEDDFKDDNCIKTEEDVKRTEEIANKCIDSAEDDDDDDDDPRLRRLKQIKSKHIIQKYESKPNRTVVIDEDEDEDEEEVRRRHAAARRRQIEEPLGPQAIFSENSDRSVQRQVKTLNFNNESDDDNSEDDDDLVGRKSDQSKRLDTDDLLKDFKPTGLGLALDSSGPIKTEEERDAERKKIRQALEQSKQEAKLTQQLHKRIEEETRRELEKEALAKGDIGAREMSSVNTDDEDDELAYEEWKLREITRVLRDRSERVLESRNRTVTKAY